MRSTSNSASSRSSRSRSVIDPVNSRVTRGASVRSSGATSSVIIDREGPASRAMRPWPISPPAPVIKTTGFLIPKECYTITQSPSHQLTRALMSDSTRSQATGDLFQALVEYSSDAIVLVDATGKVLFLSQTSERLLGHPITERLGK